MNTGVVATAAAGAVVNSAAALSFVSGQASNLTLAKANDFYLVINAAVTEVDVYQDTNGNTKIDASEFAIHLTGTNFSASDFSVVGGNLPFIGAGA
ncbi:MAG: hypothetical protein ACOH2B_12190 [Burkholderiaceae bacterium]